MVDINPPESRRKNMSAIGSEKTKLGLLISKILHRSGF